MRSQVKRGFTLIELLVVIAIIAILASILFPVFARAREKARQTQCTSNVKQLSLAIQMYSQDNNSQYPGIDGSNWVSKIAGYVGGSAAMFQCPSDKTADGGVVSYALAGILVREDGSGVKESAINSPSEVGSLVDATPSQGYPNGRLLGGGASQAIETVGAEIEPRHSKGAIVGFVDGHAKFFQGPFNKADGGNGAIRALYAASPLGLIDNPTACVPNGCSISGSGQVIIGGEYATKPILTAAAKMWGGGFYSAGFKGFKYTQGRPGSGWVWGSVSGVGGPAITAVAFDGVCVIVAKGCKIPGVYGRGAWPGLVNQSYAMSTTWMRQLFETGYEANTIQVYHMPDANASTNDYVKGIIGNTSWGTDSIEVADDSEMIEKVSADPYAIGYCSTVFADPDRVTILAPIIGSTTYYWPRSSTKFRWVLPTRSESTWPWQRSLDGDVASGDTGVALTVRTAMRTGAIASALEDGPLFTYGYWPGNY